ncbi:nitroreductase family protein [Terribacillus saccharophilus]|uniref:Nitroreductase family protein n=2 Tax=Terribacillus saccharophilus TaxID=361277 RepID=A0A268ACT5_9BACI|nr:nitroreductase family protein [Terribacillus saccharophilus]PAD21941.1 nitroreductase family protein [Terribacillus saccharophilus]
MTTNINQNDFSQIIKGRRSVRAYQPDYKIPKEEMMKIIEEASSAPSSANLQPWRVVVVDSKEGKEKLRPLVMFNTTQNDTSSAMLLIFGDNKFYENAEYIYNMAVEKGKMPPDVRDSQLSAIKSHYLSLSKTVANDVIKIDSSLFSMQLMLTARTYGYDTNPMAGFESDKLAEAFELDSKRYIPVMILSIGKAAEPGYDSLRLSPEQITFWR